MLQKWIFPPMKPSKRKHKHSLIGSVTMITSLSGQGYSSTNGLWILHQGTITVWKSVVWEELLTLNQVLHLKLQFFKEMRQKKHQRNPLKKTCPSLTRSDGNGASIDICSLLLLFSHLMFFSLIAAYIEVLVNNAWKFISLPIQRLVKHCSEFVQVSCIFKFILSNWTCCHIMCMGHEWV